MTTTVRVYPRGFTSYRYSPTAHEDFQAAGDSTIDALYRLYVGRSVNTDSWEFRKRVIAAASPLLGDLQLWMVQQMVQNNRLYGLNYQFLEDTIGFIRTGKRDMSVLTWMELMLDHPSEVLGSANIHRLQKLNFTNDELESFSRGGMVSQWLSHVNGFDDFITSMNILFGNAKQIATSRATSQGGRQQLYV